MASVCIVTNTPYNKKNSALRQAFSELDFDVHNIKYSELPYPGNQYNAAKNSDIVIIDCDSNEIPSPPNQLHRELTRFKLHFNDRSKVYATGDNISSISEACTDTEISVLMAPNADHIHNIVKLIVSTLEK